MRGLALLVLLASACGAPVDPEGTLDRARGGELRVGVAALEPWTQVAGEEPGGVEVALVKQFAGAIDATVSWVVDAEAPLLESLELGEIDIAIGGFTSTHPAVTMVASTRPYAATRLVVGVPSGSTGIDDLGGVRVFAERGSPAAGLIRQHGGIPVPVDDLREAGDGPVAVESWLLDDLGLAEALVLQESHHVMAARPGENALLSALERFLDTARADVPRLLDQQGAL